MKKFLTLGLLVFLLLIQVARASEISYCSVEPTEVDLSVSDQVTVTVYLNNTQNVTVNDTVKIDFPTAYLSCVGVCEKLVTISPYSSASASFTLKALSATTQEQSITVITPSSYVCPTVKKIVVATTTTTTTTTTTSTTTTTTLPQRLSLSLTLPKTTYYPAESFEPRATVKDPDGRIIVDASVTGNLSYGTSSAPIRFFYSTLCDCYKAWYWFIEGTLPNDYTLYVTASHPSYLPATATSSFSLIKPSLQITMSTDKSEYNPGDSIKVTIAVKDGLGNVITNARLTGEIRDADTGGLITIIYPWFKENVYYYDYYVGSESLGKRYTISISASWKEQTASDSKTLSVTKRGLNADIVLEKDVLMPGDALQGKVKVFDKEGTIITDANVHIEVKDSSGHSFKWLSSEYSDGFYEIKKWIVGEWVSTGTYTLIVKINKGVETITLEKTIEITKEKLNVQVIFDQTSYAPGDRIYIKILVTYPNGSIVPDAYIGGEMFPLTQEVINETTMVTGSAVLTSYPLPVLVSHPAETIGEPTYRCRVYISPQGPLYYKGEYIQRYYIDDVYIPDSCPTGAYALRLRIGAPGYADTEFTKEFDVALYKLLLETGFKINSRPDAIDLGIYAEVKDEQGRVVPYVSIKGYLHPFAEEVEGCIKRVYFGYDEFTNRYTTQVFLGKYECPEGTYLLEITASQPSYETATVEQGIEINYSEGFEYNVVVPPIVGEPVCRVVSCGPNCVTKICEAPVRPEECYEEVSDKECVRECTNRAVAIEETISKGGVAAEIDVKACIENCVKRMPCKGYDVPRSGSDEMLNKLEQIYEEVRETRREVNIVQQLIRNIINFINSIVAAFGGGQVKPINTTVT